MDKRTSPNDQPGKDLSSLPLHDSVRFINNYLVNFGQKSWCNSFVFVINICIYFHTKHHNMTSKKIKIIMYIYIYIYNKTKDIYSISQKSNQKGGREGRTVKTQNKSLFCTLLYIHKSLFAGCYRSNTFFHTCAV